MDPEWKREQCSGGITGGLTVGTVLLGEEYVGGGSQRKVCMA